MAGSQTPLQLSLRQRVDDLPPEWNALRTEEQVALDPPLLGAFERAQLERVHTAYALLRRGDQLVAGAVLNHVEILLDQQRLGWIDDLQRKAHELGRNDLLRFRAVMCGLNVSQGRDDLVSGPRPPEPDTLLALAAQMEGTAEALDLDGVIFGHVHPERLEPFEALGRRGYLPLPSLPYASLPVCWRDLEGYLAALRAGYRRQARADLRAAEAAGLTVQLALPLAPQVEAFTPLYQQVVGRAEQRIETLNAEFFRQLAAAYPERVSLVGLSQGDRLVAGAVTLRTPHRLICLEVGLDYGLRDQGKLYGNLLLALAQRAGELGVERLDLGQTALEAKSRLGAEVQRTWLWVLARSPLVAAALRADRAHLRPAPLPSRRVFRDDVQAAGRPRSAEPTSPSLPGPGPQLPAVGRSADEPAPRGSTARAVADATRAGGHYAHHVNPDLAQLLALFRLDRTFVRGEGVTLWDEQGREVLDLTSGYGALPFGHNPGWVWDAALALYHQRVPQMVQGSLSAEAGALAAELCRLSPGALRHVIFANSGAEAVEVALKAARAATGRTLVLVAQGAFHGKTLGALSATPQRELQAPFGAPAPGFEVLPYGDSEALEQLMQQRGDEVAALLLEPILGEGGIIEPPEGYLRRARALCSEHGAMLLMDEVQTGLGRAGRLFACEEEGVQPDAIALSKALGGGIVPSAACLLSAGIWSEDLALRHSSTFAGNALATTVGLAVLGRLTANGGELLREVRRRGDAFRARLRRLTARCEVLAEVRGRGLMIGLELGDFGQVDSPILRHLARRKELTPLLCGYLLNVHGVRVLPPLSRKTTLRLIPPLEVEQQVLDRVASALEETVLRLQAGDIRSLSRYLIEPGLAPWMPPAPPEPEPRRPDTTVRWRPGRSSAPVNGRFAFLLHPLDLQHYRELEPSMAGVGDSETARFDRLLRDLVDAVEISHVRLRSAAGATCEGWFIGLPFTTQGLVDLRPGEAMRWLRAGVELARQRGAQVVGLGAFTAVVSAGGLPLRHAGVGITTGNAYTISAANQALFVAARAMGIDPGRATCAVVGAGGAIGQVCSQFLASRAHRLLLVGNSNRPDALQRLQALAARIEAAAGRPLPISCTVDIEAAARQAQLLISTSSAVGPILQPSWLRPGAVVCDVARPADVSAEVRQQRPDVLVIDGGIVRFPRQDDLGWNFGFGPGLGYACMAETVTLALEGHTGHFSLGPRLRLEQVLEITRRAEHHGFRVAELHSFGRPMAAGAIAQVRQRAAL